MIVGGAWFLGAPIAVMILIMVSASFFFSLLVSLFILLISRMLPAGAQILPCLWQDSEPSC